MQVRSSSHSVDTSHEPSAGNIKVGKAPFQNDQAPLALIREGDSGLEKIPENLGEFLDYFMVRQMISDPADFRRGF